MSPNTLGRFEIVSELGQSDLMSVYLAKDPREARTVVLRTMRTDASEREAVKRLARFREDAARLCTLDSPNIAGYYEHGEEDGCYFLVCEYVVGDSLREQIDQNKDFSLDDILDLTRQACSAFDHAHSREIATSNLKPSRFIIESDGTLKIVDFGLAETTGTDTRPALHYKSPEEYAGEDPDVRSNLFSWGAVLYELVTGQKAFPGYLEESIRESVLEMTPPSPESVLPGMPAGISAAIMKALKKNFNDRYVRGAELVRALENYKNYQADDAIELPFMLQHHLRAGSGSLPPLAVDSKPSPRIAAAKMVPVKPSVPAAQTPAVTAPVTAAPTMAVKSAPVETRPEPTPPKPAPAAVPERPRSVVDLILAEHAPAKSKESSRKPKTANEALAQVPSRRRAPVTTPVEPELDPAGPAMPPRADLPKISMSSRTRLLVYALSAVLVALIALFSSGSHFRKVSASQPPVPPVSPVSNDPAFSEPFAPKQPTQVAQVVQPKEAVTFEIDDQPPEIKHLKHAPPQAKVVPAPAPVSGELSVVTMPAGARVQVDGRGHTEWITPCVVAGLTAGQHVVTISKAGYVVASRSVDVTAGERAEVSLPMSQLGATLSVTSNPAGGAVLVDGKDTGRVTPAQVVVPHGKHTIVVDKPGYIDAFTSADFTPGQVFKFDPVLQAMGNVDRMRVSGGKFKLFGKGAPEGMGRVQIRSNPKSAQIMLNNRVLDHDTPTDVFLEPGSYQLTLSMPGYKSVQKVISVESGGKLVVDETLQK
jgi:serine/threonine protein kinase